jgi:hypothetical protein
MNAYTTSHVPGRPLDEPAAEPLFEPLQLAIGQQLE